MIAMKLISTLIAATLAAPVVAVAAGEAGDPHPQSFIRLLEEGDGARLQTAVARYVSPDGVEVDLVGAVHIADAGYFEALNKRFTGYEAVLYEMVYDEKDKPKAVGDAEGGDGDAQEKGGAVEEARPAPDPLLELVAPIQLMASRLLKLENQKDRIDYEAGNFVHADLTLQQFQRLQAEKGESLISGVMQIQTAAAREEGGVEEMSPAELFAMIRNDGPDGLKLFMARQLQIMGNGMGAVGPESVMIGARNQAAMEVLDRKSGEGVRRMAIFYGAAHLPDFDARLAERGFERKAVEWETAWRILVGKKVDAAPDAREEEVKPAA